MIFDKKRYSKIIRDTLETDAKSKNRNHFIMNKIMRSSMYSEILKFFRAEIRRATIKMRRLRLLFLDGPGTLVRDRHPARSTIAVGLVSHRATTSGGRKGERRSPISHLVDTFIQNALITPSSTPPAAAPCVSPLSPSPLPTPPSAPESMNSNMIMRTSAEQRAVGVVDD